MPNLWPMIVHLVTIYRCTFLRMRWILSSFNSFGLGLPVPTVVWKRNGIPIIDANTPDEGGGDISSNSSKYRVIAQPRTDGAHTILDVGRLGRDELRATFSCEAFNEISEQPLETAITIDLIREFREKWVSYIWPASICQQRVAVLIISNSDIEMSLILLFTCLLGQYGCPSQFGQMTNKLDRFAVLKAGVFIENGNSSKNELFNTHYKRLHRSS